MNQKNIFSCSSYFFSLKRTLSTSLHVYSAFLCFSAVKGQLIWQTNTTCKSQTFPSTHHLRRLLCPGSIVRPHFIWQTWRGIGRSRRRNACHRIQSRHERHFTLSTSQTGPLSFTWTGRQCFSFWAFSVAFRNPWPPSMAFTFYVSRDVDSYLQSTKYSSTKKAQLVQMLKEHDSRHLLLGMKKHRVQSKPDTHGRGVTIRITRGKLCHKTTSSWS